MITVESANEVITKLQEKTNSCILNRAKLQPIIIGVLGENKSYEEYFVVVDNIKFKFENFLSALDSCFKLFQVLNIKYPKESILLL